MSSTETLHRDENASQRQLIHTARRSRRCRTDFGTAALILLALAACGGDVTAPQPEAGSTTLRWNLVARQLVATDRVAPPQAARIYAYLSVAQHGAAFSSRRRVAEFAQGRVLVGRDDVEPSMHGSIAAAAAAVLGHFFPAHTPLLAHELEESLADRQAAGESIAALDAGAAIGHSIAERGLDRARTDGADAVWSGIVPPGPGVWNGVSPQLPLWGQVTPWLMTSGSQFRAPPPPNIDSDAFRAALADVRSIAESRTPEQLEIARFWADGAGTYTPPGHWNEIAADLMREHGLSELSTARVMAVMNMAMADAMIGCWDTKYTYWYPRPYQADTAINTPIGQPPHPSYPSGHACASGAAAHVLGHVFPNDAARLAAMSVEACDSRVFAGIHYRFDAEAGMTIGAAVAELAIARERRGLQAELGF
jgi:membrane-associated phospholipid phosphatase